MNHPTLCFVAGKSGGHIIPCITLAQQAKTIDANLRILFFSTTTPLDIHIITKNPIVDTHIPLPLETLNIKTVYSILATGWFLIYSFFKSIYALYKIKPQKIISTGGYIAIPVCLAASLLRIPVELYELNVQPGKAIKWLAPYAHKINICFKKTAQLLPSTQCTIANYPIRFTNHHKNVSSTLSAINNIGLSPNKKTIFIMGGSQGSQFINKSIEKTIIFDQLLRNSINIIHQTGSNDHHYWRHFYQQYNIPAFTFSYSDTIALYYQKSDLIISRAGAGALFEILFFNKPCIVIPLETTSNTHQYANAYEMTIQHQQLFTLLRQETIEKESNALSNALRRILL